MAFDIGSVSGALHIQTALEETGYLADRGLATSCFLALKLQRPLLCEGDAGVGKTSLATSLAKSFSLPLFRLQCFEGLGASHALYEWDFAKQLLHVRAASAATIDQTQLEAELYDRRFLIPRAVLRAFEASPSLLLIDEVDRADDEFEALLLEALSDFSITVPELGTIRPAVPPIVVLTSNRTREVHDALKRRCIYHWIEHPSKEREIAILMRRVPALPADLASDVAEAVRRLRQQDLLKPPGVAESLDWASSLLALGAKRLNPENAEMTLGAVLKYHEDQQRIRRQNIAAVCDKTGD